MYFGTINLSPFIGHQTVTTYDTGDTIPNKNLSIGSAFETAILYFDTADDIRIYNRTLTAEEVNQLYQSGL